MLTTSHRFFGRPSGRLLCIRLAIATLMVVTMGSMADPVGAGGAGGGRAVTPRGVQAPLASAVAVAEPLGGSSSRVALSQLALSHASADVQQLADWVLAANDHQHLPFVILDKQNARLFMFSPDGRLVGNTAALLGAARGDDSVPGIGERPLHAVLPHERTTPAGRFVAELGRNSNGEDIVWVDYDAAVSLHRVRATVASERRLQRLASPSARDNRISYGCINVPRRFYEQVVSPAFSRAAQAGGQRAGVVYVLPETQPMKAVFGYLKAAALLS